MVGSSVITFPIISKLILSILFFWFYRCLLTKETLYSFVFENVLIINEDILSVLRKNLLFKGVSFIFHVSSRH